ncbi:MAG: SulP family inorganic anion transporter [Polyangiales bacterium]
MTSPASSHDPTTPPAPPAASMQRDVVAGLLVFLIALPLCLGIAMASGFPAVSGLVTAVVGGLLATFLGSAPLTIKGPAAGLIVIALSAVEELGHGDPVLGYHRALAAIVVAGVIQVVFSRLRAGALGDFFPSSVVHGMLAAIGVIIFSRQSHVLLGATPRPGGPLELLAQLPGSVAHLNPEIAAIGVVSLAILFGLPYAAPEVSKRVPAPLLVVGAAMAMGAWFDLGHEHHYQLRAHDYLVGPRHLVRLPGSLLAAVTRPDFSAVLTGTSIKFVVMFALVGTIESLLSARAVDLLDPWRRRSDLDRDLFAVGVGNVVAGMLGGLPMISEIVRSSANINHGARSRWANFFHGLFLLVSVAAVPWLLQRIPLAALAAMLVYTGLRLASPQEFARTWRVGPEQLVVFLTTLGLTLATDLLVGVGAGIVAKILLHVRAGMPITGMFRPRIEAVESGETTVLRVGAAAVFSNYLTIKRAIDRVPAGRRIVVDLSEARLVDHTVMERLHELSDERAREGAKLDVVGLDAHRPASKHPLAARRLDALTHA